MKRGRLLSMLTIVPALIGLTLTSCGGGGTSTPSTSSGGSNVAEYVDIKTPYTEKFSREIDIEKKLADKEADIGHKADFKYDLITEVKSIDHYTDGDTFTANILYEGKTKSQALRFYNVDTPETHHQDKGTEPWGMAAAQFTEMKLKEAVDNNKKIILEAGKTGVETTYNRVVAYIWVDGILLNMQLVEIGLGTYGENNKYQERYLKQMEEASNYRLPKNGYAPEFQDNILKSGKDDPNWTYGNNCGSAAIEVNVCIKDHDYKYDFREVGPQHEIPSETASLK
ncbi:MAG TPA: hypothetical protein DCY93_03825 [Firmicutes bacterium]|nr:hypothetical protein [Bacillota bacterium]